MTANNLLNNVLSKINDEIVNLLDVQENDDLIGNDISDTLTLENYQEQSLEYIVAIDKLLTNEVAVKFFLKKILILLSKLNTISDIDIDIEFHIIGTTRELLKNLYIDSNPINNYFLKVSKVLLIDKMHNDFDDFCEQSSNENDSDILYILKALFDNFDYSIKENINKLIFLSNCTKNNIKVYNKNKNELLSYLKLCMLSDGVSFHKHHVLESSIPNQNFSCDKTKVYSQYNEILYILSEYNHSNDLLNKYFLLYTIIENFMYRKSIATMLRSQNEFSIRDFKSFYSKIDSGESNKLKDLFKEIMDVEYSPGKKIYSYTEEKLNNFQENNNLTELINFLKKMRIYDKNFELDEQKLRGSLKYKYFAEITYQLRNAILHNTATEFHITHYELSKNEVIANLLKDFMIPILEKIILHLIITNHDLISYEKNVLTLYKDN